MKGISIKRLAALLVAALLALHTAFAAAEAGDGRMRAYRDVLRLYLQAQYGGYTMEQVEALGLYTGLVQHGWPAAALNDEVRTGYYPAWIGEWADMITEEEYEQIVPKTEPLRLPEGRKLSEFDLSDGEAAAPFYGAWLAGTVLLCSWQIVSPVFVNTKGPSPCVPSTASTEATGGIDLERAIGYV